MLDWIGDIIGGIGDAIETTKDWIAAAGKITEFLGVINGLANGDLTELSSANPIGSITEGSSVPGSLTGSN